MSHKTKYEPATTLRDLNHAGQQLKVNKNIGCKAGSWVCHTKIIMAFKFSLKLSEFYSFLETLPIFHWWARQEKGTTTFILADLDLQG